MNASIAQPPGAASAHAEPSASDMRLVIAASSAGTVFEWYDFFIYGTLGAILSKTFFPTGNATLEMLLFWLVFAVGFGFRPLGAVLFGFLGDRLGRKYTFLVTVVLMGVATAGVGMIPSAATIGWWAPGLVIVLRVLQGLALGGEYGGAAVYVAEHAPFPRRGYFTSYIQAGVVGGFVLSLLVVLACKVAMTPETWLAWGWRVPFLLSFALLAISLWMRLKLSESPVFLEMQEEGEIAGNPFVESFTYPDNSRRILVALFGVAAGLTVIFYTAMFTGMGFLKSTMHMDDTAAEMIAGVAALVGIAFFVGAGHLSDRIGRKKPIVIGYALTLLLLFPAFWAMGASGERAGGSAAWTIAGPDCRYDAFAKVQATDCGKLMGDFTGAGIGYTLTSAPALSLAAGNRVIDLAGLDWADAKARKAAIEERAGAKVFSAAKVKPGLRQVLLAGGAMLLLMALSGMTYGPVAALLSEMFPAKVRYSSMSIPYHIGTGYFGGFQPLIATYVVAKTGDPYSGLWYTWGVVAMAFVVAIWGLKGGPPRDYGDDAN
jgi:MFS family permease